MKNFLFNLFVCSVLVLGLYTSYTAITYLNEDKVILAASCPQSFSQCQTAGAEQSQCWQLSGDPSEGCCTKIPGSPACELNYPNCLNMYCW